MLASALVWSTLVSYYLQAKGSKNDRVDLVVTEDTPAVKFKPNSPGLVGNVTLDTDDWNTKLAIIHYNGKLELFNKEMEAILNLNTDGDDLYIEGTKIGNYESLKAWSKRYRKILGDGK